MFFTHFLINAHLVFFFYPFPEKETREGMRNRKFPWSGLMANLSLKTNGGVNFVATHRWCQARWI